MKGYVYMINYKQSKEDWFGDQMECYDRDDLLTQVELFATNQYGEKAVIEEIKLVKDKERDIEKFISTSLFKICKRKLKEKLLAKF